MFDYQMEIVTNNVGDSCLKIQVGRHVVSVAFDIGSPGRVPSDIRVFAYELVNGAPKKLDVTEKILGADDVRVMFLSDILDAINKVRKFKEEEVLLKQMGWMS